MQETLLGLSEVDITPASPMETVGFGRKDNLSRGVLHSLCAQIAVWKQAEEQYCLITIDHIGFSKQHADELRLAIGNMLEVPKERVMLCFSHTHSAPNESIETGYYYFVCSQVTCGVRKAADHMSSVQAVWGNAYGDIGVNRRGGGRAVDRRIGILKVVDTHSGKLRLLLLRLTGHANVLKEDNYLISPDYFGAVRDLIKERYGCIAMLTQGASGNIAPKYFKSKQTPVDAADPILFCRSQNALADMAQEIYKQIEKVVHNMHPHPIDHLVMYSVYLELQSEVPTYERALAVAKEAKEQAGIEGSEWLAEVRRLRREGVSNQTDVTELQYFAIAEGCLCGVANEIMCEFALRAKEQIKNELFYLGGYTNGCTGYFPTEEEFDEGGYEVYWSMLIYYKYHGRVFPLKRESAGVLIEAAVANAPQYIMY